MMYVPLMIALSASGVHGVVSPLAMRLHNKMCATNEYHSQRRRLTSVKMGDFGSDLHLFLELDQKHETIFKTKQGDGLFKQMWLDNRPTRTFLDTGIVRYEWKFCLNFQRELLKKTGTRLLRLGGGSSQSIRVHAQWIKSPPQKASALGVKMGDFGGDLHLFLELDQKHENVFRTKQHDRLFRTMRDFQPMTKTILSGIVRYEWDFPTAYTRSVLKKVEARLLGPGGRSSQSTRARARTIRTNSTPLLQSSQKAGPPGITGQWSRIGRGYSVYVTPAGDKYFQRSTGHQAGVWMCQKKGSKSKWSPCHQNKNRNLCKATSCNGKSCQ